MSAMEEVNQLSLQQEQVGQRIANLLSNSKKDSASRKTESYISTRLATLDELWEEVQRNHEAIMSFNLPLHNYFTTKYYNQIEAKYKEAYSYLKKWSSAPSSQVPEDENKAPVEDASTNFVNQQLCLKKQEIRIKQLHRTMLRTNQEILENKTNSRYESLQKKMIKQWEAIQNLHEEILVYEEAFNDTYFVESIFEDIEQEYEETLETLQQKIAAITSQSTPNILLPKIKLPIFSGNYENWSTFHDIFLKIIHCNPSITNIEKMQYLKTHLHGEASNIIQHLQITDGNYDAAWNLLQKRYQNTRLIASKLIDKLLDIPAVHTESTETLRQIYDVINECLEAINNLGIDTSSWGPLVSRIIVRKWDNETNKLYEQSLRRPHELQSFTELMEFLERRFQSLETLAVDKKRNPSKSPQHQQREINYRSCPCCNQPHQLYYCPQFKFMPVRQRIQLINKKHLCYNCMGHNSEQKCHSRLRCQTCGRAHHSFLHDEPNNSKPPTTTRASSHVTTTKQDASTQEQPSITVNHIGGMQNRVTLLATALVRATTITGSTEYLRMLIDPGSQTSLITEQAAQLLGNPRQKIFAEITGLGGEPKTSSSKISTQIQPRFPSNYSLNIDFLVLSKLTTTMPTNKVQSSNPEQWQNYILADPTYNIPGPIDAILGAEEFGKIIQHGLKKTEDGLLGQQTEIGWILSGNIQQASDNSIKVVSMISRTEEDKQLTKFWEIEKPSIQRSYSEDDQKCEEHFKKSVKINHDGTYTVKIPFKKYPVSLGNSRNTAVARLLQLVKRLAKSPGLRSQYNNFLQEYLTLGHMRKVSPYENEEAKYYIPHQPVIREESTTTKLRVVFDASSKTSTGISLNDTMYVGPRLQQDLADILLRWRKHFVVFSADIEKMYRQIRISKEDQQFHRILWRFKETQPIQEYSLTTVTYGTAAAPYLAIRTIQQLATDNSGQFPKASQVILKDFYVDDLLSGADSTEEATQIQTQVTALLTSGGFNLRKWCSNTSAFLQNLPEESKDQSTVEITEDGIKKSLGVLWAPFDDTFRFKVDTVNHQKITKRNILSEVAKLFDPLGWLAPVIVKAKLLIQQLWIQELEWDQPVSEEIKNQWISFTTHLKSVEEIKIPRWLNFTNKKEVSIELHGFCDASEKAYGAVIYARTTDTSNETKTVLLVAKSKVAPAKSKTTLPRLELCATVLLAKLIKRTTTALEIKNIPIYAWTDSMVVLGWLKGDPSRWKTFVANKVSEVNQILPAEFWHHVSSEENPADAISRGLHPSKIKDQVLWWNGPHWLARKSQWPHQQEAPHTKEEMKLCCQVITQKEENSLIQHFSSLTRLVRVLSYCRRFINNARGHPKLREFLSVQETDSTILHLVKLTQNIYFRADITNLKNHQQVDKSSKLLNLNPFLDSSDVVRVGGRLKHSSLTYQQKHPIILPQSSHLSLLIIRDAHQNTLHGSNQATLAYIRRKYWIINGKEAVRSIISKCVVCLRYKAQTSNQLMGDLPAPRVTLSPPFLHSGVDYAGPIQIRAFHGRGHKSYKGYIAVFVCLSTKAIHLEVVSSMTTDAFMAAFRRFISRRGRCAHIYSDNGTNFVGASKLLEKEVCNITSRSEVQDPVVTRGTQWHFIPPAAPHFGGLWEAGVKSMKYHLKRVIGNSTLTYEELTTLLHQIEACLNSRPLYPLDDSSNEVEVLTPGHFLIGREIVSPPNPVTTTINSNLNSRWKLMQKMKKDFWKSWTSEYLNRLQQRYKWKTPQENLHEGEIVLLKEDNINPSKWPLARITEVHPGSDNKVRVVTIKKSDGNSFKRSVTNLIPLPKNSEDTTSKQETTPQQFQVNIINNRHRPSKRSSFNFLVIWVGLSAKQQHYHHHSGQRSSFAGPRKDKAATLLHHQHQIQRYRDYRNPR